ncbi:hypothetical protein H5410_027760 [Solanum commersonii]|uniref:Uncharacterized protein n=1 Tax=Solanum commersonii TaxID=4109 RepID=A0A9J5Z498_SOLCO|nr:hypothetical protein H5410_027760 [Solanum commersonii]
MPSVYTINPNNFQVTMMPNIHPPTIREAFDEDLRSRICQSLKYENLSVHPNVELPPRYTIPKFNTFNMKGDPVSHLKDYCSRLVGIGNHLLGKLSKALAKGIHGKDMFCDFVKQYEFNNGDELHIAELLNRLEASNIYPSLSEEELISTFIHVQEGQYYENLLETCAHNFFDLIKVGKDIENGIQGGRIVNNSATQFSNKLSKRKY